MQRNFNEDTLVQFRADSPYASAYNKRAPFRVLRKVSCTTGYGLAIADKDGNRVMATGEGLWSPNHFRLVHKKETPATSP